jgi:NAD(P)-dependent dehydrogenase (short-subunit alcohol dehydrogenase family)
MVSAPHLSGHRVVIVGGTSGLGFALAELVTSLGAEVLVASRRQPAVDKAVRALGANASGQTLDVTDEAAVRDFFDSAGPFDHLVYSAAEPLMNGPLVELDITAARQFFAAGRGHLRHWTSPPVIDGDGDIATGQAFLMVLRPGSAPAAGVILTGLYRDAYRKVDGRWCFAERIFSADPQPEHRGQISGDPLVGRWDAFVAARVPLTERKSS